jgi:hypothetical protein
MAKSVALFRQALVERAIKGVINAGLSVSRVRIGNDGEIEIFTGQVENVSKDPLDKWLEGRNAR